MTLRRKTKIVFLTDCLADVQGGAEKQIYELASRLAAGHHECVIASLECEGRAPRGLIESAGCGFATFPVKRIYGFSGLVEGFRFYNFLRRERVNVLTTYHFSSDIWGAIWGRLAGVKVIISNRRDLGFWRSRQHIGAYKLINGWVTKIVVVADAVKEMVAREEGYPQGRVVVIYNGVEIDAGNEKAAGSLSSINPKFLYQHFLDQWGAKPDSLIIMHAAQMWPVKGHRYLFEAALSLTRQSVNFKLILLGSGELEENLKKLAISMGLRGTGAHVEDKIIFLGKRSDVPKLLKIADICVLPSLSEGMSNAILEYMAAGKPVVATRVGGNPELVVDGETGILVEPKDVDGLASGLSRLLLDPELRKRMGEAGRARVEKEFSMAEMIRRYEALFHELTCDV